MTPGGGWRDGWAAPRERKGACYGGRYLKEAETPTRLETDRKDQQDLQDDYAFTPFIPFILCTGGFLTWGALWRLPAAGLHRPKQAIRRRDATWNARLPAGWSAPLPDPATARGESACGAGPPGCRRKDIGARAGSLRGGLSWG